jgi:hypothetical protein
MRPYLVRSLSAALVATGCASALAASGQAPENLRPPVGEVVYIEALASGVQIYECTSKADQPSTYEWVFRAPEARLVDRSGRPLGKHYAGPTWESTDGSAVVGEVQAKDPGPSSSAIPWLLLATKSKGGRGSFSESTHIQRVKTVGGLAPAESCSAANARRVARVPYTATYYFYRRSL